VAELVALLKRLPAGTRVLSSVDVERLSRGSTHSYSFPQGLPPNVYSTKD
jgi:hypothetical protein